MANICIHEDTVNAIENVKPKGFQKALKMFQQGGKNRNVLQPLGTFQQNVKQTKKAADKEKSEIPRKIQEKTEVGNLSAEELIKLKPVFKKSNIVQKTNLVEKEYEEDIWNYLHFLEKNMYTIKPNYMSKQMHINWDMRRVLIDWLVNVAQEYKMNENTLHLTVNYLDRFLSNISVIREKFQLVGATAMMLAGKMEEIYPPDTKEWSYLTGDTFTVRQIIKMEQLMLRVLNFEMNPPTILDFIRQMCSKFKIDNKTMYLSMYLSELVLLEGDDYLQHLPSKVASASLLLARHILFKSEPWTKKMEETAGYSLKQLSPVVQKQHKTFKSSPFKEQQAIQKKYASDKYQRVALLKPRMLVLDDEE